MKKKIPTFRSDEEAERFVETADLSLYDLSGGRMVKFEFLPKDAQINLRIPELLLEAVREKSRHEGISYQKYIRRAVEQSLLHQPR